MECSPCHRRQSPPLDATRCMRQWTPHSPALHTKRAILSKPWFSCYDAVAHLQQCCKATLGGGSRMRTSRVSEVGTVLLLYLSFSPLVLTARACRRLPHQRRGAPPTLYICRPCSRRRRVCYWSCQRYLCATSLPAPSAHMHHPSDAVPWATVSAVSGDLHQL